MNGTTWQPRFKEIAMAQRKNAAPALVDGLTNDLGGPRTSQLLDRLDAAVPWEKLAKPVLRLSEYRNRGAGRPAWPAITMLKCLLLAKWFNLSDPQLEECLQDRLSFRRFVGLSLTDSTPDETTFVVFRRRLREAKLHEKLFDAVLAHIEQQGLLVREGTLVDATIIEQSTGRKREDGTSTRDEDASFTKKHGRTHHGYKGHIAADRSGIVVKFAFSTAKDHDSRYIDELTEHEPSGGAVIADSAYSDQERRRRLRQRGVIDGIVYKRVRGQAKLHDWQERWNRLVAKLRAKVEHPLGMMKQQFGYRRVRYRGLERNAFDFCVTLIAANVKRSLSLAER
jgi:transposase, IS5 family